MNTTQVKQYTGHKGKLFSPTGFLLLISLLFLLLNPARAELVNINKANVEALEYNLNGIGPVKARAIVNYRKKNGPYRSVNDLAKVPGIGKETILKNKKSLSTSRGLVKASASQKKAAAAKKAAAKADMKNKKASRSMSEKDKRKLNKKRFVKNQEAKKKATKKKLDKKKAAKKRLDKKKAKKDKKKSKKKMKKDG